MSGANSNREGVQAINIKMDTFIGVPANQDCAGKVVTLGADGDITFHFASGDKVVAGAKGGMSFVAGMNCTGVTSAAIVII